MKPKGVIKIKWSSQFAYAIGLITTDGSLSKDGRHITVTSKDKQQLDNFISCINKKCFIGETKSGTGSLCLRVQIGDVKFYKFLVDIGLMPNKSKILSEIKVPTKYFFDFLRGCFDGDGSFYSYKDKRWKSSYMFYLSLVSASKKHIEWIQNKIKRLLGINGHITKAKSSSVYQLKYAKKETLLLLPRLYYSPEVIHLGRKLEKIKKVIPKF